MPSEDADLFFEQVVATHLLHIAPRYTTDLTGGAQNHLDASLLKYSEKLGGVPLSYSNLELVHSLPPPLPTAAGGDPGRTSLHMQTVSLAVPTGAILFDNPCIHVAVRVQWCLFAPRVGVRLRGCINVVTREHLGLLIFDYFSAVVYASQMQAVLVWVEDGADGDQEGYWRHKGTGQSFGIGEQLEFQVIQLLADGPVLTIVGSLDRLLESSL